MNVCGVCVYCLGLITLRAGMYLRNAVSFGWDICLSRQHGLAPTVCAKTFVVYVLHRCLVKCPVGQCVLGLICFSLTLYVQTGTDHIIQATFCLHFARLHHKLSVLDFVCVCLYAA
jgi:hypothetical protein